jgi:hypothetical protein
MALFGLKEAQKKVAMMLLNKGRQVALCPGLALLGLLRTSHQKF